MAEAAIDVYNNGWTLGNSLQMALGALPFVGPAARAISALGKAFGKFTGALAGLARSGSRAGRLLEEYDEFFRNPHPFLEGKGPEDVQDLLSWANESGWRFGRRKTGNPGFRMYKTEYSIEYRAPCGPKPRHFADTGYWKVSSGRYGVKRIRAKAE